MEENRILIYMILAILVIVVDIQFLMTDWLNIEVQMKFLSFFSNYT